MDMNQPTDHTILVVCDATGGADHPLIEFTSDQAVITASGVEEALTILLHNDVDLVLVDEIVGEETAAEVCERLRRSEANPDVPILLATRHDNAETLAACAVDADGVIPFRDDPILARAHIESVLRLDRFRTRQALRQRLRETEASLQELHDHDSATGLPNAISFNTSLQEEIERARDTGYAVGVMVVEFSNYDDLATVCDYAELDQLFRKLAARLTAGVRGRGVIGRLDSRCLVVSQPLPRAEELVNAIDRMRRVLMVPFETDTREVDIECSIGGSAYPNDADQSAELVGLATSAMAHARRLGRNHSFISDPTARVEAQRRIDLESRIRDAIHADALVLHFQPRLQLSNGRVNAVEALLRLHGEDGRLLTPNAFMSIASDSGLMESIGLWALDKACEAAAELQSMDIRVAVNVAGDLFAKEVFQNELVKALRRHRITGHSLELDLSERAIQPRLHGSLFTLQDRMTRIQRDGVHISLDNFGAGHTCLNDLRYLSIDNLKLAQDMISSIPDDERMNAFVGSLLSVGKSLDMRVIAQGVEKSEQIAALRDMGCEDAQGFLFAKPMSIEDLKPALQSLQNRWSAEFTDAATADRAG